MPPRPGSIRAEAARRGVTVYRVRLERGVAAGRGRREAVGHYEQEGRLSLTARAYLAGQPPRAFWALANPDRHEAWMLAHPATMAEAAATFDGKQVIAEQVDRRLDRADRTMSADITRNMLPVVFEFRSDGPGAHASLFSRTLGELIAGLNNAGGPYLIAGGVVLGYWTGSSAHPWAAIFLYR